MRRIGWRGGDVSDARATLARVAVQHRSGYQVHDGNHLFSAQPAGYFLKPSRDPSERPVVGDFVELEHICAHPPQIVRVLPRRTALRRGAAGEHYAQQLIATNMDYVLVLTGLDGDFNLARMERYLALIEPSGARPVVVLSKRDMCNQAETLLAQVRQRLPEGLPIHAINGKDPNSAKVLMPYLGSGDSAVLVGSSGAGKSTLLNTLLGVDQMATGAVRQRDSRGRHTTTHRALFLLPSGGCLMDTPGMRELKLIGAEQLGSFSDIEALAGHCRFADCAHGSEPGCAVRAALDQGALPLARWQHYLKLHAERVAQSDSRQTRLRAAPDGRSSKHSRTGRRKHDHD